MYKIKDNVYSNNYYNSNDNQISILDAIKLYNLIKIDDFNNVTTLIQTIRNKNNIYPNNELTSSDVLLNIIEYMQTRIIECYKTKITVPLYYLPYHKYSLF